MALRCSAKLPTASACRGPDCRAKLREITKLAKAYDVPVLASASLWYSHGRVRADAMTQRHRTGSLGVRRGSWAPSFQRSWRRKVGRISRIAPTIASGFSSGMA